MLLGSHLMGPVSHGLLMFLQIFYDLLIEEEMEDRVLANIILHGPCAYFSLSIEETVKCRV